MHAFNVILIGILSLAPIGLAVPAPRIERRQVARQSSAMVVEQRMRVPFSAFRNPKFTMRPVVNAAIPLPTLPIVSIPLPTVTILPTPTSTPSSSSSTTTRTTTVATSQSTSFAIPTAIPQSPFKLVQSHSGSSFLNGWDFFNYRDPTNGQVNYLDERNARSAGLAYTTDNGSTVLRVDDYTWLGRDQKRNSVRITSKETVKIGSIVVFDAAVMPYGPSVWPAFWSVGQNWPTRGEIDIMEGVHSNTMNQMTLHTTAGCTLSQPMNATGRILTTDCDVAADSNIGCGVQDRSEASYGKGFNDARGGVYVTFFDESGISVWFFLRGNIPADITEEQPNFLNWGLPRARFDATSCDMNKYFGDQTLVINITLCGDWAGNTFNSQTGIGGSCNAYVENPYHYSNARFEVNSVKVYHK